MVLQRQNIIWVTCKQRLHKEQTNPLITRYGDPQRRPGKSVLDEAFVSVLGGIYWSTPRDHRMICFEPCGPFRFVRFVRFCLSFLILTVSHPFIDFFCIDTDISGHKEESNVVKDMDFYGSNLIWWALVMVSPSFSSCLPSKQDVAVWLGNNQTFTWIVCSLILIIYIPVVAIKAICILLGQYITMKQPKTVLSRCE